MPKTDLHPSYSVHLVYRLNLGRRRFPKGWWTPAARQKKDRITHHIELRDLEEVDELVWKWFDVPLRIGRLLKAQAGLFSGAGRHMLVGCNHPSIRKFHQEGDTHEQ